MPALKQYPDVLIKRRSGEYKMVNDGKDVMLKFGSVLAPPGGVRVYNNSQKYLTFNIFEDDGGYGTRTKVDSRKVNPGKSLRVSAPGGLDAPAFKAGVWWYYLGDFDLRDEDPAPTDSGGKTEDELKKEEAEQWLKDNWWIIALFIALGVGGGIAVYYVMTKERAQIVTVQA